MQGFGTSFKVYTNMDHSKILCLLYIRSIKVHTRRHWNNSKSSCLIIAKKTHREQHHGDRNSVLSFYDLELQHTTEWSTTSFTSDLSSIFDFSIVLANRSYTRRSLDMLRTYNYRLTHMLIQGGSNMTGTDLYVNKPHCVAAVRP